MGYRVSHISGINGLDIVLLGLAELSFPNITNLGFTGNFSLKWSLCPVLPYPKPTPYIRTIVGYLCDGTVIEVGGVMRYDCKPPPDKSNR